MKQLLFVALMMVCSVSWAEWEYTGKNESFVHYVDRSTIRNSGAIARMWVLADYFAEQTNSDGKKFKSDNRRLAFNCMQETTALIAFVEYSDSMGKGRTVSSEERKESDWDWRSFPPDTTVEVMFKIACGNK